MGKQSPSLLHINPISFHLLVRCGLLHGHNFTSWSHGVHTLCKRLEVDTTGFWLVGWALERPGLVEGVAARGSGVGTR